LGVVRLLNGHLIDLQGDELERFFVFAYKTNICILSI